MKENKKYLIIGIVSVLVLMLGFSLAYFAPIIRGEGKKITLRTGSLSVVFTDNTTITEEEILPGWSTYKTFTVENESNNPYYYNINLKDVINTFVTEGFLQYKITSTNGYNMEEFSSITKESFQVLGEGIEIAGLETQTYAIYFRYVNSETIDQSEDMNKEFTGYLSITEGKPTLYSKLLSDNTTILTRTDFSTVFTDENTGTLYKTSGNETEDINGDGIGEDVYYFSGNAQNNWVKFGKDQDDADLYWRIIRTNEDGSIRLLYIGPDKATESAFIKIDGTYMSGHAYNALYDNTMYVGYMYGTTGNLSSNRENTTSSNIKLKTDEWYSKTMMMKKDSSNNLYDKYISRTAIYCNDRSADAYSSNYTMYYASYRRLKDAKSPSYKCGNNASRNLYNTADEADKFSVSTSAGGNGQLEYPIAHITADEIAYAGGVYGLQSPAWYYYNSINSSATKSISWATITPYYTYSTRPNVFVIIGSNVPGRLADGNVDSSYGIRPVLSLKSCVKVTSGDGSSDTPYEVTVDTTCASLEN